IRNLKRRLMASAVRRERQACRIARPPHNRRSADGRQACTSPMAAARTKHLLRPPALADYARPPSVTGFSMPRHLPAVLALPVFLVLALPSAAAPPANFTMAQVLDYPFVSGLVAAERADRIAWVRNVGGVRNVWVAEGPSFKPRQITRYTQDDGQEITQLTFS